jgi:diaminopimelate decarboxylase
MNNPLAPEWLKVPSDLNELEPKIWPSSVSRDKYGEMQIAGVAVTELTAQFGTPLYVIDEDDFRSRALRTKRALQAAAESIGTKAKVYYAGKAFLCTEVAHWVAELGLNLDVSSGGELAAALAGGVSAANIGVHGNNKSLAEIGRAVAAGVGAIVIDSDIELERIASAAQAQGKVQAVRIRVNAGVHAHTHEYLATAREDQKFGIARQDVAALVDRIRSDAHLELLGIHSHIGSQIFEAEGFIEAARRLIEVHAELLETGPVPELNLGGGFGINYTSADNAPEIEVIAFKIAEGVRDACAEKGIQVPVLAFEPGRAIAGQPGITLYTVGTIKDVTVSDTGKPAVRKYVSVDGGMSDNARPSLYEADYHTRLASRISDKDASLVRVVGKHCESGDIVVRADYLPSDVSNNDIIAVAATGAYCYSLSSNYNFLTRPPVVAVRGGQARLIVRGETEADLFARDVRFQEQQKNLPKNGKE